MVHKVKKGNQEYGYKSVRNPVTKRPEKIYLGNVNKMPKIVELEPSDEDLEKIYPEFYKALECDRIEDAFVELIKAGTECYLEDCEKEYRKRLEGGQKTINNPEGLMRFKSNLDYDRAIRRHLINDFVLYIKSGKLSPELVKGFRELLVHWLEHPAYEVIEEKNKN